MYFSESEILKIAHACVAIWNLIWYVVSWAYPSPHPKWYLDRFIRFCRAHGFDQQTHTVIDTETDQTERDKECDNWPHLRYACDAA